YLALVQKAESRWQQLCKTYLPVESDYSIWRSSRLGNSDDAEQGWKLHVSATVLSAIEIFERVAPFLQKNNILFKAPNSLKELKKINSGLFYGFSQVGKFITVYPKTTEIAVEIADRLHQLTEGLSSPPIPYDLPLRQNSCVYYRYGSFSSLAITNPDGTQTPAVRTPQGNLVPDLREPQAAVPHWVTDPFIHSSRSLSSGSAPKASQLQSTFRAYEALSQRGKGGVYRALDLSVLPARLCILKEGRKAGEIDWDGRDGYWRVKYEAEILSSLKLAGVKVPEVYATFQAGENFYLAMEAIEGETLQALLQRSKKLPIQEAIQYGIQIACILEKLHAAGWIWRDCKPMNLMRSQDGTLRAFDFEGACQINALDPVPWGTSGYLPPESLSASAQIQGVSQDLYALGSTLHQMLSNKLPTSEELKAPIGKLRRGIPRDVRAVIVALLDRNPTLRPDAQTVRRVLQAAEAS
ncbi:protein kinase, partial [Leptolyngbya sp. FACHB-711]|uniref:class III lanthionine synthetase LanKC N-terminal domain-containing protein n=1 Tax=Leptolyngbya sp. FACHB-711 TaxID=2692813 RepID=UPI001A7EAC71